MVTGSPARGRRMAPAGCPGAKGLPCARQRLREKLFTQFLKIAAIFLSRFLSSKRKELGGRT